MESMTLVGALLVNTLINCFDIYISMDENLNQEYPTYLSYLFPPQFTRNTFVLTTEDIKNAILKCEYDMVDDQVLEITKHFLNNGFNNITEAILFFANALVETDGLTKYERPDDAIPESTLAGIRYYPRGLLMMMYPENYVKVSHAMTGTDVLLKNPDYMLENFTRIFSTSIFCWNVHIRSSRSVNQKNFRKSTERIFKVFKRRKPTIQEISKRYRVYFRIATLWEVKDIIIEEY